MSVYLYFLLTLKLYFVCPEAEYAGWADHRHTIFIHQSNPCILCQQALAVVWSACLPTPTHSDSYSSPSAQDSEAIHTNRINQGKV